MRWENLREEEFDKVIEETGGICVIPIGCMEAHGEHLPVGTDNIEAEAIAMKASEMESMCIFPTFMFGNVIGLVEFKGSVRLEAKLTLALLENLCDEIARNGFKKIVFLNYHGGNMAMLSYFCDAIQFKAKDYVVVMQTPVVSVKSVYKDIVANGAEKYPELMAEDIEVLRRHVEEHFNDGHAGVEETSIMLAARPETVRLDRVIPGAGENTHEADYVNEPGIGANFLWNMNYPNSFAGTDPSISTANIGKMLMRLSAEKVAEGCRRLKTADNIERFMENKRNFY